MRHISRVQVLFLGLVTAVASMPATSQATDPVDLELVLAVDVSRGINEIEARRQREGYAAAFTEGRVLDAIKAGIHQRIAVALIEWSDPETRSVVVDWTLIDGEVSARRFSAAIRNAPPTKGVTTSISQAIEFALPMFNENRFLGIRRVIDISGDGVNNFGGLVTVARDKAVAAGVTINGLPITDNWPNPNDPFAVPDLDKYYAGCVIGGPGAFFVEALSFKDFASAVRRKLILEISDLGPPAGSIPLLKKVAWMPRPPAQPAVRLAATGGYAPGCDIGERLYIKHKSGYGGED